MALEVIAHLPGCEGGNCSTFWRDSNTGDIWIRALDPSDPAGRRELDVRMPAADWALLRPQLP
jgi:hypothetical protein